MSRAQGIDCSAIQGQPDFEAVAAYGISFMWHKATEGSRGVDPRFATNRPRARNAGLLFGAYHFFAPEQDAVAQADHFCSVVKSIDDDELAPAIDLEVLHGMPAFTAVARACAFVERVEQTLGRQCIIYTMPSFWTPGLSAGLLASRPLWLAHYRIDPATGRQYSLTAPHVPAPWNGRWWVWQTSGNRGPRVPGIECDVDRNEAEWSDLRELLGGAHDTIPAPAPEKAPDTKPSTPPAIRRSSQRIAARNEPIANDGTAVTPLRAGPGEKEYDPDPGPEAA